MENYFLRVLYDSRKYVSIMDFHWNMEQAVKHPKSVIKRHRVVEELVDQKHNIALKF